MERYKLPAGKLATIFYKGVPKAKSIGSSSDVSDTEKGHVDPDAPPKTSASTPAASVASHNGRVLAWDKITLKLKIDGGERLLLNNLNGEQDKANPTVSC